MIWKNKFHERINELWERAKDRDYKLTQTEFSKRFGVTRNAFIGWLRGSGQPDADGFVTIARSENVSLSWLLGDDRPQTKEELFPKERELLSIFRSLNHEHREDLLMLAKQFQSHYAQSHVAEGTASYICTETQSHDV
ncbi:helix-turn-helix domain-containing protein [Selenomonas sp. KH1T6]|uniref:helix-turn-helix domain-containing protein n=1 Tax=Selenomonas sp. KH1T6 TaxID=3158784 RepID=UPI0008A7C9B1|nr:hypothetical protein SAMN05216583_11019 [Selenomonas ruminantium]